MICNQTIGIKYNGTRTFQRLNLKKIGKTFYNADIEIEEYASIITS